VILALQAGQALIASHGSSSCGAGREKRSQALVEVVGLTHLGGQEVHVRLAQARLRQQRRLAHAPPAAEEQQLGLTTAIGVVQPGQFAVSIQEHDDLK
jgi:hypothetical protein